MSPQSKTPTVSKAAAITERCVFVKVRIGTLCNQRKVDPSEVEVDADKALINVSKHLVASEELQAIQSLDGEIKRWLYSLCLPFEKGIHLLPLELIERVDQKLRRYSEQKAELAEAFVRAYPRLCQEAAQRLRALYDPGDYPSPRRVRSTFYLDWQYITFGIPDQLKAISAQLFREERQKIASKMEQAYEDARQALRVALYQLVEHLRQRLQPGDDGKAKRLSTSTVEKLREFLNLFDFRNVTDDRELSEAAAKIRGLMSGVTAEQIRESANLRDKVRSVMDEVGMKLETMTAGTRKFRLDEEDE